jgi:hypothetical protein
VPSQITNLVEFIINTIHIFMGQASNWVVNHLQAVTHPTIHITLPRMIQFLIAAPHKFISLLIVGNTTLVQTEEKSLAS